MELGICRPDHFKESRSHVVSLLRSGKLDSPPSLPISGNMEVEEIPSIFLLDIILTHSFSLLYPSLFGLCQLTGMEGKKVVVVGAGPVGSLAAIYASSRAAHVEIYELRSGKLISASSQA